MPSYVALLRAVNVGGSSRLLMADLRTLFEDSGFESPQTLLQTGNVLFRSSSRSAGRLETRLEEAADAELDLRTDFFVRSASEWQGLVGRNPFLREAAKEPNKLLVVFLKQAPPAKAVQALQASTRGPERVRARGKQAYIHYPDGVGKSRLTSAVIEKGLGCSGTARNWNTVGKLAAALGDA